MTDEEKWEKASADIREIMAQFDGPAAFGLAMSLLATVLACFRVPDNDPDENSRRRAEMLADASPSMWRMIDLLDKEVAGHA